LAAIDAGADALIRATQSWNFYRVVCANKMNQPLSSLYNVVGPLCYEGDIPAHNRMLPELAENDILAFIDVGSYTTVLFNNYNGRPSPLVLMISENGEVKIIKKRQTFEDLIQGEIL
jgi:diaminopimelate decarboxylase